MEMTREQVDELERIYKPDYGQSTYANAIKQLIDSHRKQAAALAAVEKEKQRLDHEHDYDVNVIIPDLVQQLTSAQATIATQQRALETYGQGQTALRADYDRLHRMHTEQQATIQRLTEENKAAREIVQLIYFLLDSDTPDSYHDVQQQCERYRLSKLLTMRQRLATVESALVMMCGNDLVAFRETIEAMEQSGTAYYRPAIPLRVCKQSLQALAPAPGGQPKETTMDIEKLVDRFLAWPLPESVCSDLCATMKGHPNRSGTTLLTAVEARQMLEYVLAPTGGQPGGEQ